MVEFNPTWEWKNLTIKHLCHCCQQIEIRILHNFYAKLSIYYDPKLLLSGRIYVVRNLKINFSKFIKRYVILDYSLMITLCSRGWYFRKSAK